METIICERRTYSDKSFTHSHPYSQLIVPIYGVLSVSVGQETTGEEQRIIFIPPRTAHSFCSKSSNQFFVIDAPVSYLPRELTECPRLYPLDGRWKAIRELLSEEVGSRSASNQRLADLFRYISGFLDTQQDSVSLEYIKNNFTRKITVKQLADMEHFNSTYYVEWFKRRFGRSPMSYIRDLRLQKAEEMLIHTDFPLMQIAQQVGYENQATLTRLFQKGLGITPSEFREENRKCGK